MNSRFLSYIILMFLIVFIISGCSRVVSNTTNTSDDKRLLSENNGQATNISNIPEEKSNEVKIDDANKAEADKSKESKTKENTPVKSTAQSSNIKNTGSSEVKKSKKLIVIDPGHGGKSSNEKEKVSPDSDELKLKTVTGATGINSRIPEHVIALEVSNRLKALLEKEGYNVIMTRTTGSETLGNIERAEIGNKNKADLVIRIHADSAASTSAKGASMLVPGEVGYAKSIFKISRQYGEVIYNSLLSEVKMKGRGIVVRKDLTGFNWSQVPVVLIEMGFLSNPEEDRLLSSSDYQNKIALGLSNGIKNALSK